MCHVCGGVEAQVAAAAAVVAVPLWVCVRQRVRACIARLFKRG